MSCNFLYINSKHFRIEYQIQTVDILKCRRVRNTSIINRIGDVLHVIHNAFHISSALHNPGVGMHGLSYHVHP